MPVTLRDVAAHAKVSPTVVSRVLHNRATSIRVSESTAERVRQSALELGYRINIAARNFRDGQTLMLGVLHGIGFGRPYFSRGSHYFAALVDGIVEGAFRHGYSVTFCPKLLGQSPESAMMDGRFDGLIWYSTSPSTETMEMLLRSTVPLVLIHTPASRLENRFASAMCDNDQGIGLALQHLVELGHRDIAFFQSSDQGFRESHMRVDSFLRHMTVLGLPTCESSVINIQWDWGTIDRYMAAGPQHTALIAESDDLAANLLTSAQKHGIDVPGQLSIVGFDSTDFCNQFRPTLTSVRQPLFQLGECAIDLLVESIGTRVSPARQLILPCSLDIRGSTSTIPHR